MNSRDCNNREDGRAGVTARRAWLVNLGLAAALALAALAIRYVQTPASAAGGSWDTDGVMANTTEGDTERLVIVDTQMKNMTVYKTDATGEFRLVAARTYKHDMDIAFKFGDVAHTPDIEKRGGITAQRAFEMYHATK